MKPILAGGLLSVVEAGCASPSDDAVPPPAEPSPTPARLARGLRDLSGPVELWGGWLEASACPETCAVLSSARDLACRVDLQSALDLIEHELAQRGGSDATLLAARGGLLAEMGFLRAAELDLQASLELDRDRAASWWALGVVRARLRQPRAADEALTRSYELGARDPELLLLLAEVKHACGELERAALLHAQRARALDESGMHDQARLAYERALECETDPSRRRELENMLASR